jgi:Tfp pilus assembly protein PilN
MQPDIAAAQDLVKQVAMARRWTDRRPRFLNPLRELTLALPAEGGVWISSLGIQDDLRVVFTGKAKDEQVVLAMLDSIRSRAALRNVQLLYIRDTGVTDREAAFSLTFDYVEGGKG